MRLGSPAGDARITSIGAGIAEADGSVLVARAASFTDDAVTHCVVPALEVVYTDPRAGQRRGSAAACLRRGWHTPGNAAMVLAMAGEALPDQQTVNSDVFVTRSNSSTGSRRKLSGSRRRSMKCAL